MTTPPNPFAAPEPGAAEGAPPPPAGPAYGTAPGHGTPPPYGQQPAYGQQPFAAAPPGYGQQPFGQVPPPYGQQPFGHSAPFGGYPASPRTNGMAVASMVLGILWIWWLGSVLALVFGYVAKSQIAQRGEQGGGMATAGIVLGWIGVGFFGLFVLFGLLGALGSGY